MTSIEPFIHRKVVVLPEDALVQQAARALCERRVGCVITADHEGHVRGIVTDRDLVCSALAYPGEERDVGSEHLSEVMTEMPIMVDENAEIKDVIDLMETNGIRRIPVVNQLAHGKQKCVGIVTLDDLIASRSIEYSKLSRIVQSQIFRRGRHQMRHQTQMIRARERAEAHASQTLTHFYKVVSVKTQINSDRTPQLSKIILEGLVQRLHYTGAAHLIAQLPRALQDELLDLPAGPDRTVTVKSISSNLAADMGFDEAMGRVILSRFWSALEELVDLGQLTHVKDQLPLEFQDLFRKSGRSMAAGGNHAA